VLFNNDAQIQTQIASLKAQYEDVFATITELESILGDQAKTTLLLNDIKEKLNNEIPVRDKIMTLSTENYDSESIRIMQSKENINATAALMQSITALDEQLVTEAQNTALNNTDITKNAIQLMMILIAVGVILSITLGIFVTGMISKPIRKMTTIARKVVNGESNLEIDIHTKTVPSVNRLNQSRHHGIAHNLPATFVTRHTNSFTAVKECASFYWILPYYR